VDNFLGAQDIGTPRSEMRGQGGQF
jgi:hypothetical protein